MHILIEAGIKLLCCPEANDRVQPLIIEIMTASCSQLLLENNQTDELLLLLLLIINYNYCYYFSFAKFFCFLQKMHQSKNEILFEIYTSWHFILFNSTDKISCHVYLTCAAIHCMCLLNRVVAGERDKTSNSHREGLTNSSSQKSN